MNLNIPTELFAFPILQMSGKNGLADPRFVFAIFSHIPNRAPINPPHKATFVFAVDALRTMPALERIGTGPFHSHGRGSRAHILKSKHDDASYTQPQRNWVRMTLATKCELIKKLSKMRARRCFVMVSKLFESAYFEL